MSDAASGSVACSSALLLIAVALGAALYGVAPACGGEEVASEPAIVGPRALDDDVDRAVEALGSADAAALASLASPDIPVRVEIRQALVETDERAAEVLDGRAAVGAWLSRTAASWRCGTAPCRWPEGLDVPTARRCFGDCCDFGTANAREVREGTLRLRRLCLAGRENGARRLTLLAFVEAR